MKRARANFEEIGPFDETNSFDEIENSLEPQTYRRRTEPLEPTFLANEQVYNFRFGNQLQTLFRPTQQINIESAPNITPTTNSFLANEQVHNFSFGNQQQTLFRPTQQINIESAPNNITTTTMH